VAGHAASAEAVFGLKGFISLEFNNTIKWRNHMATYKEIQKYVKDKYDISIKDCWIAHVKELNGLNPKISRRRISKDKRKHPCPANKRDMIESAFRHFKMI
jgi:hypothetical protein